MCEFCNASFKDQFSTLIYRKLLKPKLLYFPAISQLLFFYQKNQRMTSYTTSVATDNFQRLQPQAWPSTDRTHTVLLSTHSEEQVNGSYSLKVTRPALAAGKDSYSWTQHDTAANYYSTALIGI
jgi:hypothetical protein